MVSTVNCQRPWASPLDSLGEIISPQCLESSPRSNEANWISFDSAPKQQKLSTSKRKWNKIIVLKNVSGIVLTF